MRETIERPEAAGRRHRAFHVRSRTRRWRPADRRRGEEYRGGRAPARARALSHAGTRDSGRRLGADPQHGDRRRQLLQRTRCLYFYDDAGRAATSARPAQGCDAIDGFNRDHAILGASPRLRGDASLGHVRGAGRAGRRRARRRSRRRVTCRSSSSTACPATPPRRHGADAGRADHRDRRCRRCALRCARPIARCATAPATPSRWSRWRPALELEGGTVQDVRLALGGVAQSPGAPGRPSGAQGPYRRRRTAFAPPRRPSSPTPGRCATTASRSSLAKRTIVAVLGELAGRPA